jgi:hypothetical protein
LNVKSPMVTEKPANSTICRLLIFFEIDSSGPDGTRTLGQAETAFTPLVVLKY